MVANFKETSTMYSEMKKLVVELIQQERPSLDIYEVTDVPEKNESGQVVKYTVNIKHLNKNVQYNDVAVLGVGIGNLKGIYKPLKQNDLVVVGWFDKYTPVVIGSISDYFSQTPDNIPLIKDDEMLIVAKTKGAIIYLTEDNSIIIRSVDSSGDLANGSKIKLSPDGSFKVFDKGNYGITSDGNGNIDIFGDVTIHGDLSSFTAGGSAVVSGNSKSSGTW